MLTLQCRFKSHQSMCADLLVSHEEILLICFRIWNIIVFSCGGAYFEDSPCVDRHLLYYG